MKKTLLPALIGLLACTLSAGAVTISYNVSGFGPVTPPPGADTVQLIAFSGSLVLLPEVAQIAKINTLTFTALFGPDGIFFIDASRTMVIDGVTQTLTQSALLSTTFSADTFTLNAGLTQLFNFGAYTVEVTPLQSGPIVRTTEGTTTQDANARFVLHTNAVPDGGITLSMLAGGILCLHVIRRKLA